MTESTYLVIKMSSLGDIIQSYSFGTYLKQKNPNAHITWLVEERFSDLVKFFPFIDKTLSIDTKKIRKNPLRHIREIFFFIKNLRKVKHDVIFDLQGNVKSSVFLLFARAKTKVGFSKRCVAETINLLVTNYKMTVNQSQNISLQYLELAKNYFKDKAESLPPLLPLKINLKQKKRVESFLKKYSLNKKTLFMICPHSYWNNKKVPQEVLIQFLKGINDLFAPFFLFIFGNFEEKRQNEILQQVFPENALNIGQLEMPTWHLLISYSHCVISMDSCALHLAALTNTPTFSFFGPSSSNVYGPCGARHFALQGTCPYDMKYDKRCKKLRTCLNAPCISNFSPENLIREFEAFYKKINMTQHAR